MIAKAEIQSIDYSSNTCMVLIPLFNTVAGTDNIPLRAQILIQPGIYNGYIAGDIVWVAFENGKADLPVVIGKLYKNAQIENNCLGGAVKSSHLTVNNSCKIPVNTELNGADSNFNSIAKLINFVNNIEVPKKYQICLKYLEGKAELLLYFDVSDQYTKYPFPAKSFLVAMASVHKSEETMLPVKYCTDSDIAGVYGINNKYYFVIRGELNGVELDSTKLSFEDCVEIGTI